ncbi:MAG TPA: response regulator [Rariglobus sp.]
MAPPVSNSTLLRLLIVEDNRADAALAIHSLERGGRRLDVVQVDTRERFLEELAKSPDIILCDYSLPTFSAPEAIDILKDQGLDVPFIILSGSIGEETAVEMIKRGADDYLLKDRIGRLDAAIQHALEQKALRDEARRSAEHLRQSEFKYRCLFDHLMDAAYLCDAGTMRIIDTNRRSEHLLGLDRAAILGARLSQYFAEGALDRLKELTPDEDDSGVRFEATSIVGTARRMQISATSIVIPPRTLLLVLVRPLDE